MFGIGLPEMLVILAVALIVVGPEKLPDLAKSVAKTVLDLKKTLNQVKASLADEENLIGSVKSDLHQAADDLKDNLLEYDQAPLREVEITDTQKEAGAQDVPAGGDESSAQGPEALTGEQSAPVRPAGQDAPTSGLREEEDSDARESAAGDSDPARK